VVRHSRDDRRATVARRHCRAQQRDLLVEGQAAAFPEGTQGDDARRTRVEQHPNVTREEDMIDRQTLVERRRDRRQNTTPFHRPASPV
jgi:hypothetical protein